ncbi:MULTISPECIES: sensor histidine kinase [Rhodanobacter]|uniref:histidine kinase n=1 Tax=Rhodanobacter denitrificans TaxID=666685 RepID=M4NHG5_9GAMM|nr:MULTISPECIES: ATP-binding protein [Rhodanobacter]AGG87271.1 signal transduction histidine kinase [Rhodanobacter denitrificans]KZC21500.1 two-component sensor histidine kinase [Rhodanobacter denitrificans]UJJ51193.1 ATP-binding protein [Rhodanobacter denitrificans]UJJ60023.1 ATP-binding protein [Rhodanobacter denitrificans]UJM86458.1 ATP-binding protein [Rhodanobacter denitrificans]
MNIRTKEQISRLLHSAAFRLGVLQAASFAFAALVLFAITWVSVSGYVTAQLRQEISDESSEMTAVPGSIRVASINKAVAHAQKGTFFYGLFSPRGDRIAGSLAKMPPSLGWTRLHELRHIDSKHSVPGHLLINSSRLEDGNILAVAHGTLQADQLNELLLQSFIWAGLAAVVLALAGGVLTARSYLSKVETITQAASNIVKGDLGTRIVVTDRDDEFDRLARSLNRMLARLQSLMEGMRQVSNDIAHDLRTPLTHLRHKLEATTLQVTSVEGYRESCTTALADVDHVLATFAALLRIAQIENQKQQENFTDVDLSGLLGVLVGDFAPVFEDQGRSLHARIHPGAIVRGDAMLLTQMFANLVENALHHTPPHTPVFLSLLPMPGCARAIVRDTGPGIPKHERERVLQRFVRLDSSRSTPGSGLGLALVTAVAQLHEITVSLGDGEPGLAVQIDFQRPV